MTREDRMRVDVAPQLLHGEFVPLNVRHNKRLTLHLILWHHGIIVGSTRKRPGHRQAIARATDRGHAMAHVAESAWVAPNATVTGDVSIGAEASVWYGAVIRGDMAPITIGPGTNVQDNAVIHVGPGHPVRLGNGVTVGHAAIVHGCSVGDNSLIGMGAIVLDGARIGRDCIIGAGALVTQSTVVPDGTVWFGSPARQHRNMSDADVEANRQNALAYVEEATRMK